MKHSISLRTSTLARFSAVFLVLIPAACSTTTTTTPERLNIVAEYELSTQLSETSGLYCSDGKAYTINDSGNSPTLFTLDPQGKVVATVDVAEKNRDWEAVSADDKFFYIGDFGNNGGKRKDLVIHKVARSDFKHSATLAIDYADNDIAKNSYYSHDFDAESLVAKDDHLVMFSKSWLTKVVNVYQVDPQAASQSLSAVAQISGIPGVITGLDWDKYNQRFVIVGYNSNAFGVFDPFIALVSNAYELQELFVLEGYGQVEGVCVTSKDELWFTQEKSPFNIAKLVKVQLLNEE